MREPERESLEPTVLRLGSRPDGDRLLGSQCRQCGRYFFPQRDFCAVCAKPTTIQVTLSQEGILTSFTEVFRTPQFSLVGAPYTLGEVTLPEGVVIYTVIVARPGYPPQIGMPVRLETIVIRSDESHSVLAYVFRPPDQSRPQV